MSDMNKGQLQFMNGQLQDRVYNLEKEKNDLLQEVERLEEQESKGMECTIDMMLSRDCAEKWGLDEHSHRRNVQHIFTRACSAINDLEDENKALKSENSKLREVLMGLRDVQNGPPLIRDTAEWNNYMSQADDLLKGEKE